MEGNMKNSKEYKDARDKAYKEAGHNAYFSNGFEAGFDFAMSQPKHIFDGVAKVGEVRRFGDELVDVVKFGIITGDCEDCVLYASGSDCMFLTSCDTHDVKYIKR